MQTNNQLRPYKGYYKGRTLEIQSSSSYEAQKELAKLFKAKRSYEVTVVLLDVIHHPASI